MLKRRVIEPIALSDQEKLEYLAEMHQGDIYPAAFEYDNEFTLINLLARKVVELQERVDE